MSKEEVKASSLKNEKVLADDTSIQDGYLDEDDSKKDIQIHGGDTALADAPWKFKIIALVTALLFPCKYNYNTE